MGKRLFIGALVLATAGTFLVGIGRLDAVENVAKSVVPAPITVTLPTAVPAP